MAEVITYSANEISTYAIPLRRDPLLVVDLSGRVVSHGTTKTADMAAGGYGQDLEASVGVPLAIASGFVSLTTTPAASAAFEFGVRHLLDSEVRKPDPTRTWLFAIQLTLKRSTVFISQRVASGLRSFVEQLARDQDELEDEGVVPSIAGFEGLLAFLSVHQRVRMPSLTVSDEGAFVALWDMGQRARVRIDFTGDGKAKWVIATIEGPTGALLGGSGIASVASLDNIVEAYDAWAWMS
jgi:hypothetical protein